MPDATHPKRAVGEHAARLVEPGMKVGLGTGSTAAFFVAALGVRVAGGLDMVGVPTSEATRRQAESLGIRLATLEGVGELDLTIDGADELDGELRLIKGGGGALLREKIVAASSRRMVVIADETKRVATLGRFPLPVEIVSFGAAATIRRIAATLADLGMTPLDADDPGLRVTADGTPFRTDGGHLIVDLPLGRIPDPDALAAALKGLTGVVDHGLFIGLAHGALIATAGGVMEAGRPDGPPPISPGDGHPTAAWSP